MVDLVGWLTACLDEDAKRAITWHDLECEIHQHMDAGLLAAVAASRMLEDVPGAVCDCGGPARVLREIEAKRRLLDEHKPDAFGDCVTCAAPEDFDEDGDGNRTWSRSAKPSPCPTLRLLALPYADREGYQESWRP